ncbi:MAG: alpha/beta hydrolase [Clostridia bacterium]|nr:alpha/beta hydrolase [Clostridia bacterium]
MAATSKKRRKGLRITLISILLVFTLLTGGVLVVMLNPCPADQSAIESFLPEAADGVTDGSYTVFAPDDPVAGFIFYPGARVEHEAYIPLMQACAAKDILCILVEMPMDFPLLWGNAADGLQDKYPEIDQWYIGGHSLGGYMAAGYLGDHADDYVGLILMASYTETDLSGTGLDVLTIYGSEDSVLNKERYEKGLTLLPEGYTEIVIDGGCHAYFGMYTGQDGGDLPVTNAEQLLMTADAIRTFVEK